MNQEFYSTTPFNFISQGIFIHIVDCEQAVLDAPLKTIDY